MEDDSSLGPGADARRPVDGDDDGDDDWDHDGEHYAVAVDYTTTATTAELRVRVARVTSMVICDKRVNSFAAVSDNWVLDEGEGEP